MVTCAPARRDVRKLGGDVTATDKHDVPWQRWQRQEAFVGDQVLLAGNIQFDRLRTRSNQNVLGNKPVITDLDSDRPRKTGLAMIGIDSFFAIALFTVGRHGIREAPLECHQVGPVDRDVSDHALVLHPTNVIGGFHTADEHLLGITTTQRAGPAKRTEINDSNAPTRSTDLHGSHHRGGSGTDNHQIVVFGHGAYLSS